MLERLEEGVELRLGVLWIDLFIGEKDLFNIFERIARCVQLADNMEALEDLLSVKAMTVLGSLGFFYQTHRRVLVQDLPGDATTLDDLPRLKILRFL